MLRIALVAEKPSLATAIVPSILRVHRDVDRNAFIRVFANPIRDLDRKFDIPLDDVAGGLFRYPRNLSWRDLPTISEPRYGPIGLFDARPWMPSRIGVGTTGLDLRAVPEGFDVRSHVRDADVVYAAMDASSPSVHAFDRAIEAMFPEGVEGRDVRYPWFTDFTEASIEDSIRRSRPWLEIRSEHLDHSRIKRRFTFNYALNAHAVLGRILSSVSLAAGRRPPADGRMVASRNCLQLLYWLRGRSDPIADGRLVHAMQEWKGTGRHSSGSHTVFGSAASRADIVQNLEKTGLVERRDPEDARSPISISPLGRSYLDLIHPDCEDPDQGFRLEAWRELPSDEAIPKVDRYIRTFFGKQKRFGEKALRRIE